MNTTDGADTIGVYAQETFAIVPTWVLMHPGLSDRAVRLYGVLRRYADRHGVAWPARGRLAADLHCSRDTIDRALTELRDARAVVVRARWDDAGDRTSSVYVVQTTAPAAVDNVERVAAPVRPPTRTGAATVAAPVRHRTRAIELETPPTPGEPGERCPKHVDRPGTSCRACGTSARALRAAARAARPPWCGECDEGTRQVLVPDADGRDVPKRCPVCHPLTAVAS